MGSTETSGLSVIGCEGFRGGPPRYFLTARGIYCDLPRGPPGINTTTSESGYTKPIGIGNISIPLNSEKSTNSRAYELDRKGYLPACFGNPMNRRPHGSNLFVQPQNEKNAN